MGTKRRKTTTSKITSEQIEAAAGAIANVRVKRNGMPQMTNIMDMLPRSVRKFLIKEAKAALKAAAIASADVRDKT